MKIPTFSKIKTTAQATIERLRNSPVGEKFGLKMKEPLKEDVFYTSKEMFADKILDAKTTFNKLWEKFPLFGEKDYSTLSPQEVMAIRSLIGPESDKNAVTILETSKALKNIFDAKYGENGYVFVAIGRSPAAMAKCMGFLGVESKVMPLSGLSGCMNSTAKTIVQDPYFKKYLKFLDSIGLSSKAVKRSDKKYIFADFCIPDSGSTLRITEKVMKDKAVGLPCEKLKFVDINQLIEKNIDTIEKINPHYKASAQDYIQKSYSEQLKTYSSVDQLHYLMLDDINHAVYKTLPSGTWLMHFNLLDKIHNPQIKL